MKCYKLVFDSKIFGKNAGGILVLLFFVAYLVFGGFYIFKGILPLKQLISKLIFKDNKDKPNDLFESKTKNEKKRRVKNKENQNKKVSPPKKKGEIKRKIKNNQNDNDINDENDIVYYNKNKNGLNGIEFESIKSEKNIKSKNLETFHKENIGTNGNLEIKSDNEKYKKAYSKGKLDDFELNRLEFSEAVHLDKRKFLQIYLSILNREELIMLTFLSWNDHNLFYVKIPKFIFLLCTEMTMNSLLFADKTIHKLYINEGTYNLSQSIPHIIYSILITHAIEIILCFLTMTDTHVYQIKALIQKSESSERIFDILKCIRIKLIIFFISTTLIFLFYWYCVSAFCAVYQETQGYLILNSFLSFLVELIEA